MNNTLFYLGSLLVLCSIGWSYTLQLEANESLLLSAFYTLFFFATGAYYWRAKNMRLPGGLLISLGVIATPVAIYSLQNAFAFQVLWSEWALMEISTLLVASIAFSFIRFPLILALIYLTLWFLSMDLVYYNEPQAPFFHYTNTSIALGSALLLTGWVLQRKDQPQFAFWSYLVGMCIAWIGLTACEWKTEWGYFLYFAINTTFFLTAKFFHRTIFLLFGSLGVLYYMVHLANHFSASVVLPYLFVAVGVAIIFLAAFKAKKKS